MSVEQLHWPASDDHDEQLEELVAAQALGSIEAADAEQLQAHLPRCERCRRLLVQYGAVVDTLPLALEPAPSNPQQHRVITAIAAGGEQIALVGTEHAPAASGEVLQPPDGGPPLLLARGLPNLAPSEVYQVWIISNGQPVGVGLLNPPNGTAAVVSLDRQLTGAEVVALTVEPPGGSLAPTGPIVLAGKV